MNFFVAIVNKDGKLFSFVKPQTPKLVNQMKTLCAEYKELFNEEYKVVRYIMTRGGYKRV